jgi:hypothetical protein
MSEGIIRRLDRYVCMHCGFQWHLSPVADTVVESVYTITCPECKVQDRFEQRPLSQPVTAVASMPTAVGEVLLTVKPPRWEYLTAAHGILDLNEYGNEGWELVSVVRSYVEFSYIFKRQLMDGE